MDNRTGPTVSVIIPTYNRETYIAKAIESVLDQTFRDFELIVVDDGSTDNTPDVLARFGDRIRVIRQQNAGVSAALNAGILTARGEWVAILGSDDEWHHEKLAVQMEDIEKWKDIVLHTVNAELIGPDGSSRNNMELTGFMREGIRRGVVERPLKYQIKYGLARAQCMLARRVIVRKAGLFDENLTMYEDQDLMCRLALEGPWGVNTAPLVYIYRRNEEIENLSVQRFKDAGRCYEKLALAYKRLRKNPRLSSTEVRMLDETVASYITAAGMEFLKEGNQPKARRLLRNAISERPTAAGILRYVLSFFPCTVSILLLGIWHKLKQTTCKKK